MYSCYRASLGVAEIFRIILRDCAKLRAVVKAPEARSHRVGELLIPCNGVLRCWNERKSI